ncbi:unnamed protein product [Didymodactylos carnosus]|uniref:Uncharacterized protein n=1 Tax=Didymodactylos carnosus TaxID=1234261 RepID=A0A813YEB4_9BILA|nr:unnamed protein product [Didymodactylos carnosus]CAF0882926.1 unnamed protein product [Didymodactylos carnosus]CAF3567806.1 unnamed protein product [Didymodactylos carnosus]CAF3668740.1 unnamed protein product [Didymodactylos carnosus]
MTGLNIRAEFCGHQDCDLNALRLMTGSIIDVDEIRDFQEVEWTIMYKHHDPLIRSTQETCTSKPPSSFSVTDIQYQRSRTHSSLSSFQFECQQLPFYSVVKPNSLLGKAIQTCGTHKQQRVVLPNEIQLVGQRSNSHSDDKCSVLNDQPLLIETAKWENQISDGSDHEDEDARVTFRDMISVAKLSECLKEQGIETNTDIDFIHSLLSTLQPMTIKCVEKLKHMDGSNYYFQRLVLNDHILFPSAISKSIDHAKILAYKNMIDTCCSETGIKMKSLSNNRCKVTKRPSDDKKLERDLNASYITSHDLTYLSQHR